MRYWENQQECAQRICKWLEKGKEQVLLVSQTQAGKTGTAVATVELAIEKLGLSKDHIYFICGMNDISLKSQASADFVSCLPESNVLFSKDLEATVKGFTTPEPPLELLLVDECHHASAMDSLIDKFVCLTLPKRIVSISATPMAESILFRKSKKCAIEYLKPGKGYLGLLDIIARGWLRQSYQLTQDGGEESDGEESDEGRLGFIDMVSEQYEEQKEYCPKYNIVRLPDILIRKDLEEELEELGMDIDFKDWHSYDHSGSLPDINILLGTAPKRMTIIWIYGSLRAGKRLDTRNVGFVHDTAHSRPDTTLQGLLGRVTGYDKRDKRGEPYRVLCYTDAESARLMAHWIRSCYNERYVPRGARNIKYGFSFHKPRSNWVCHPPLLIKLDGDTSDYFREMRFKHSKDYPYRRELLEAIDHGERDEETGKMWGKIRKEYRPDKNGLMTIFTELNSPSSYRCHFLNNYKAYQKGRSVRGFNLGDARPAKYYRLFIDLKRSSDYYGYVLVTYKEHALKYPAEATPDTGSAGSGGKVKVKDNCRIKHLK